MTEQIKVQSSGSAILLNRWLAYATHKLYQDNKVVKQWSRYEVQWLNIKADFKGFFTSPIIFVPRVAYSLIALWFILKGRHEAAIQVSFFMGAITAGTASGAVNTTITMSTLSTTTKTIGLPGNHQGSISAMSLNGSALSYSIRASTQFDERAEIWFKDNPGALTSVSLTGTYTGGSGRTIGYLNLEGTANGAPDQTYSSGTSVNAGNNPSLTVLPTVNNCCIIGHAYSEGDLGQGAGETNIFDVQGQSYENAIASYTIQTTATSQAINFTQSGQRSAICAVVIRPAGSSASLSVSPSSSVSPSVSPSSSSSQSQSPSSSVSPSPSPYPGSTYIRTVTIDHTKVSTSNQTNFPILVAGTYAYLATVANGGKVRNANGYDIQFYSDANLNTKLSYERERYVAATGEIAFWIRIPTLSVTVDTVIYMTYGDALVTTDLSTPTAVWDSNYKGVYHLPDGTTLGALDSTSNANNGTISGATATTGAIAGGASFNGSSNYILGSATLNLTTITVSAWVTLQAIPSGDARIIGRSQGNNNSTHDTELLIDSAGKLRFYVYDGAVKNTSLSSALSTGTRYYVVGTADGTTARAYLNGSQSGSVAAGNAYASYSGANFLMGGRTDTFGYLQAQMDEIRISSGARSAGWILTEYNNQNSPSTFYTLGSETSIGISPSASSSPSSSPSRSQSPSSSRSPSASSSPSSSVSASPSASPYGGILKRWTGSAWTKAKLKTYSGGTFQIKPLYVKKGGSQQLVDTTGV